MASPTTSTAAITLLSTLRCIVGIPALITPTSLSSILSLPPTPTAVLLGRLGGVRDIAFGIALCAVRSSAMKRNVLSVCVASDILDMLFISGCYANGYVGGYPASVLGGGSLFFMVLGLVGLRGIKAVPVSI
ncbi:hypothetical protein AJ79_05537 [Helicocarpus griseus UAMH5409]|uniref:Uncharacterized protein n=1 Tax=Helicocarpus griseus UAMH5409 TaxID=1447875 RepID=A0A2B7XMB9_9EURO|nr:hypothetical protein AJ79_05537 [Helicocarpus griseus UAMH5409]